MFYKRNDPDDAMSDVTVAAFLRDISQYNVHKLVYNDPKPCVYISFLTFIVKKKNNKRKKQWIF